MIEIKNLEKAYNKEIVLTIPELKIEKGELFGLVGNNGAGKTTLFNLLLDLIRPSRGYAVNNGIIIQKSEDWKAFTGSFIDESFTIGYLTPDEYFSFIAGLRNMNKTDLNLFLDKFDDFFNQEIRGKKNISEICRKETKRRSVLLQP